MKVEYFGDTDTLSIVLVHEPARVEADDTSDPDVTLLFDEKNRIAEIVIEHASRRLDLNDIRSRIGFEEIRGSETASPG